MNEKYEARIISKIKCYFAIQIDDLKHECTLTIIVKKKKKKCPYS